MKNTSPKRSSSQNKTVPAAPPLTKQAFVEKWFLPVVFVVIGAIIIWTFVNAYRTQA